MCADEKLARTVDSYVSSGRISDIVEMRAFNCHTSLYRVSHDPLRFFFVSKGLEKWSKGPWSPRVVVKNISGVATRNVVKLNISVYCNCPYFRYWGPYYNNKHKGDIAPNSKGVDLPPVIRDPSKQNFLCKHLVSALTIMQEQKYRVLEQVQAELELRARKQIPEYDPREDYYKRWPKVPPRKKIVAPPEKVIPSYSDSDDYYKIPATQKPIKKVPKIKTIGKATSILADMFSDDNILIED